MSEPPPETVRVDIWLWRARFFRTRRLATEHVSRRGLRITRHRQTRRTDKPGTPVAPGDVLTFGRGPHIQTIKVMALGVRRGPPDEARALYSQLGDDDVQ